MKRLLVLVFSIALILTGCGSNSKTAHYIGKSEVDKDGQYYIVEYDKKGEDITNVKFDYKLKDGKSEEEISKSSVEKEDSQWNKEVEELNEYVNLNDFFPSTSKKGEGDKMIQVPNGVAVSMDVTGFKDAFNAAKEA